MPSPPYADSAATLRAAGITTVACLLDRNELPPALEAAYAGAGLRLLHFPVPDMGVPRDADAFHVYLRGLLDRLAAGEAIYLHCFAGLGRTGTALACLLMLVGESAATAVAAVREAYRREAVESGGQRRFVEAFAARVTEGAG